MMKLAPILAIAATIAGCGATLTPYNSIMVASVRPDGQVQYERVRTSGPAAPGGMESLSCYNPHRGTFRVEC
ncbi:hypothetical protein FF80_03300 [Devosia sp. LC5]|nr:hypothetical protein FF80_03300 [Devosia sp. LC5]